jgi:hypothetical protein
VLKSQRKKDAGSVPNTMRVKMVKAAGFQIAGRELKH